ncbi:MAG: amidohydrolase family protein [Phycisphaeraceae bacterium]|nr:amidohydrolase family protein [Phycisphaeraceae bacterium]
MTMRTLHLENGRVIDPSDPSCSDQVRDLYIEDGKFVAKPKSKNVMKVMDLTGKIVMAGAIDMHTHLVSPAIAALRTLQEKLAPQAIPQTLLGSPTWLTQQYQQLGYTAAVDAAITPGDAPAARLQLREFLPLNTSFLLLLSHHQPLLEKLEAQQDDQAMSLAVSLFKQSGAMGIKLVNPGSVHAMDGPALDVVDIDQTVAGMRRTPREVLRFFLDVAEQLKLAHPLHIHLPQLGTPGSCEATLQWIDALDGRRAHIAHLQYDCYLPDPRWYLRSGAQQVLTALQSQKQITADLGLTGFGPAYALTADLALHDRLLDLFGDDAGPALRFQWEGQSAFALQQLDRDPRNLGYAMQWAVGLELVLLSDNLDQLSLTLDYPNGGAIAHYPHLIACLMNKPYRDEQFKRCHKAMTQCTSLKQITRELSLTEIAKLTRTSPARALGLQNKGRLQPGADADLVIYRPLDDVSKLLFNKAESLMIAGEFVT